MSLGHGFVTGVASKGANPFAVQWLVQAIDKLCHVKIMLQSDQENAVESLLRAVQARLPYRVQVRANEIRSHGSQGGVERWFRTIEKQFRGMKTELERVAGVTFVASDALCTWLIRQISGWVHVP